MTQRRTVWDQRILWAAALIYATMSTWMAWASRGFLEADGITHFLARRFALSQPLHLVGVWSRPLCVAIYCIPATLGGLLAVRAESLLLVLLAVPLTTASARRVGLRRPAWAGLFLLTQPLLFAHSFSELTEVPFALLLVAVFYCYQRRWFGAMAVLVAVSPLGRPEGFGLLAVAAVTLLLHRRFAWLLALPLGLAVWSYTGWRVFGSPPMYPWWKWLSVSWPYSPQSVYGNGSVLTFVRILPAVVGPIAFGFLGFGVARLLRSGSSKCGTVNRFFASHRARCRLLVIAIPLGVLAVHTLLWATGKMASNGEPRYLLVAAPFWAILSAAGLEKVAALCRWRRPLLTVAANAAIAVGVNFIYPCLPLGPQDDDRLADRVTQWIDERPALRQNYPKLFAWMPHVFFTMDVDKQNNKVAGQPTREEAEVAPDGTLLMWDSTYSAFNSSYEYVVTRELLEAAGWLPIYQTELNGHIVIVYVSPRDNSGNRSSANSIND